MAGDALASSSMLLRGGTWQGFEESVTLSSRLMTILSVHAGKGKHRSLNEKKAAFQRQVPPVITDGSPNPKCLARGVAPGCDCYTR